jgi:hypothetical protein
MAEIMRNEFSRSFRHFLTDRKIGANSVLCPLSHFRLMSRLTTHDINIIFCNHYLSRTGCVARSLIQKSGSRPPSENLV